MANYESYERITQIQLANEANTYLEIGVRNGATFFQVPITNKVGVDPCFAFDYTQDTSESTFFFPETSDQFFDKLANGHNQLKKPFGSPPQFDVFFLDGFHSFEQTYRDFVNSLAYSHDNTIWLLDDTVPSDPYSAIPDYDFSLEMRARAGISGAPWHGDVFKVIFAIHDMHPEISYCTLMNGNPQTVLWKQDRSGSKKLFEDIDQINGLGYFDIFRYQDIFFPIYENHLLNFVTNKCTYEECKIPTSAWPLLYKTAQIDIAPIKLRHFLRKSLPSHKISFKS